MGNIFYFAGIVFILEAIRGIFTSKHNIDNHSKYGVKIPDKTTMNDPDKLKETIGDLVGELKSKALESIIAIFYVIWNIYGIFNTTEWIWFSFNFTVIFLSNVMTSCNEKLRTVRLNITVNSICILIMSYILYLHFFNH